MTNTAAHSVRSWLGIPYASAERFRRPILLPFNPDLRYDQNGPAPLQAGDTNWLEADTGLSEDCLNLNVWAPDDTGDKPLPVIVYIFGGGFEVDANTQTTSNASAPGSDRSRHRAIPELPARPFGVALALPVRGPVRGRHQSRPAGHHLRTQASAGEHHPIRR